MRFLLVFLLISFSSSASMNQEQTLCGWFQERLIFQLWYWNTPKADQKWVKNNPLIEKLSFKTSDNRVLQGYKYLAHNQDNHQVKAKGYILMALGNAMIADQTISGLKSFSMAGFDTFIFDYRGYGNSTGKRRINAFIEDYKALAFYLNKQYQQAFFYGVSLGGAVVANAIGRGAVFDKAVIDSSPSRFSPYGCPKKIDPVENIPEDASNLMLISGEKDLVVDKEMTKALRDRGKKNGAKVLHSKDFSHPFMDANTMIHKERLSRTLAFFLLGYK